MEIYNTNGVMLSDIKIKHKQTQSDMTGSFYDFSKWINYYFGNSGVVLN